MRRRATEKSLRGGIKEARERCSTLAGFVREAWKILEPGTPYIHGWNIDFLCRHLEAITRGELLKLGLFNRAIFNVPPGTMKSLLSSVFWPAFEWGPCEMPYLRYLSSSFNIQNVVRDSRRMRDLVESEWYRTLWPHVALIRRGEASFENSAKGSREGRAFSSLTGGRADRVIIDDPNSTESAESEAERSTAIRIARESVPLRVNDPARSAIIIIMQRLHEHDVTGTMLALKLGFMHVMLPMEFEPERRCVTPFGEDPRTDDGELLWEERFPREVVERDKIILGSYGVAGQFQQRPAPRGGLMFKRHWFEVVPAAPAGIPRVRGWDLAATKKKGTGIGQAYTSGVLMSRDRNGTFYIEHVVREREEGAAVRRIIKNTAIMDGVGTVVSIPQDPGQAGKVQAQDMVSMLAGFLAFASPETGDKATRAEPVAAQAEAGNIKIVKGAWNDDFFAELELFPTGAYKDQVDALSRAFGRLIQSGGVQVGVSPIISVQPRTHFGDHPEVL